MNNIMNKFFIFFYRLLYMLLKTALVVAKPFLPASTKTWINLRLELQISQKWKTLQLTNSLWVHASSGEIEYGKYLIQLLKKNKPEMDIIVTYSSKSAEKLFGSIRNEVTAFIPIPWDDVHSIRNLINKINPQLLLIAKTDLWPEMLFQCHQRKIPVGLIAFDPHRLHSWGNQILLRTLLKNFAFISCINENTQEKLKLVLKKSPEIRADGDTRFDRVFSRLDQPSSISWNVDSGSVSSQVFVCGSIWPEDEVHLVPALQTMLKSKIKIILCPHDVSEKNVARLDSSLAHLKASIRRLSQIQNLEIHENQESSMALISVHELKKVRFLFDFDILIVDLIGYLADMYRSADIAFVGGSFKDRVHSVMEPLCCGLPVIVGPKYKNNSEARYYSANLIANELPVKICNSSVEIQKEVMTWFAKANQHTMIKKEICDEMLKNRGSSERLAQLIMNRFLK